MEKDEDLERCIISQLDLLQSLAFAKFILEKQLHERATVDEEKKLIHLAFNTALIVSYCRPFHRNKSNQGTARRPSLPSSSLDIFTADERKLHDLIIKSRDKEYAHSDLESYNMLISQFKGIQIPISRDPFIPLNRDSITQLISIIEKLVAKIS